MKILIDHQLPFAFAHGGLQIQIEQTKAALEKNGTDVEYLRFWDAEQLGDVLHVFGRFSKPYIELAQRKGMAVVMSDLLSETGSRSRRALLAQKGLIHAARKLLPATFLSRMGWDSYKAADVVIALTAWEAELMVDLLDADMSKIQVVPNGVEDCFFLESPPEIREDWLLCTGTITPRKRTVELARAAVAGKVKIRIVGKPYSEQDPYYREFLRICATNREFIDFPGPIHDRTELARAYSRARGFVLFSLFESLSLSALEAAAAGCHMLITDLPWARTTFGDHAAYCPPRATIAESGRILRNFSETIETQPKPKKPLRWAEVGNRLLIIYDAARRRRVAPKMSSDPIA
jgi:glycosyltransferase involved in cell wall biosynthesis